MTGWTFEMFTNCEIRQCDCMRAARITQSLPILFNEELVALKCVRTPHHPWNRLTFLSLDIVKVPLQRLLQALNNRFVLRVKYPGHFIHKYQSSITSQATSFNPTRAS